MAETEIAKTKKVVQIVYVLQALAFFTAGLGALAGVIMSYMKRDDAKGTWAESHFTWQIRTFWIGLIVGLIGLALSMIFIGFIVLAGLAIWYLVRIIKGWLAMNDEKPIGVE